MSLPDTRTCPAPLPASDTISKVSIVLLVVTLCAVRTPEPCWIASSIVSVTVVAMDTSTEPLAGDMETNVGAVTSAAAPVKVKEQTAIFAEVSAASLTRK